MNIKPKSWTALACLSIAAVLLSACGGGDNGTETNLLNSPPLGDGSAVKQLDATAGGIGALPNNPANKFTYFNLETGQVLALSDADAETSTDWHIAFKRTNIKLNGGVSGPGTVKAAIADAQDGFYNADGTPNTSVFTNTSADISPDCAKRESAVVSVTKAGSPCSITQPDSP